MADTSGQVPFFIVTAAIGAVAGALIGTGAGMAAGVALAGSITATTSAVIAGGSALAGTIATGGASAGAAFIANNVSQALNHSSQAVQSGAIKMQEVAEKGKAGEIAAGITKNTQHIPSLTGTANFRIPDGLDHVNRVLSEVKNYATKLSLTSQLRDFVAWSQLHGYRMDLYTNATLSGPLRELVDSGIINLVPLGK